jgi:hypothetical protein
VSTRIDENGVKTKKLWLKHDSRGLLVEDFETRRALGKETGGWT